MYGYSIKVDHNNIINQINKDGLVYFTEIQYFPKSGTRYYHHLLPLHSISCHRTRSRRRDDGCSWSCFFAFIPPRYRRLRTMLERRQGRGMHATVCTFSNQSLRASLFKSGVHVLQIARRWCTHLFETEQRCIRYSTIVFKSEACSTFHFKSDALIVCCCWSIIPFFFQK